MEKKLASLCILKILQEESDENHPLTQPMIGQLLKVKFGLSYERKAIKSSLTLLQNDPFNYDIIETPRKGVYLAQRDFEPTDILYINTYIMGAKGIPSTFAKKISNKLSSYLSKNEQKYFKESYWIDKIDRTKNKQLQYTIDAIFKAILNNKKISFKRMEYASDGSMQLREKNGYIKEYIVSPYYLYNSRGMLYLLCNSKDRDDLNEYRVEYITEVHELESIRTDLYSLKDCKNFNIAEYINNHLYATGGSPSIEMKLKVLNPSYGIKFVKDWFGSNSKIEEINGNCIATAKTDEQSAFWWIMQYSEHFKLLGPNSLIEKTRNAANNILKNYTIK